MKKIFPLITALVLIFSLVGCGVSSTSTSSVWYTDNEKDTKGVEEKASKEMNDLVDEMMDQGFLKKSTTVTVMDPVKQEVVNGKDKGKTKSYGGYKLVGAQEGYRFALSYNESKVNIELYLYGDRDEVSDRVIDEVKKTGKFQLSQENEKIEANLSKDEKILMIYQDSSNAKKNISQKEKAVKFIENYSLTSEEDNTKATENTTQETTKEK